MASTRILVNRRKAVRNIKKITRTMELIATARFDIAIVDANLAGVSAGPAVTALRARGVPFIVLSGYSVDQLPGAFLGARFMRKPFIADRLIHCLKSVLVS